MRAAQRLHAGLLIAAGHQPTPLIHRGCLEVELADRAGLGVEVGIMAIEPVDAAVRLEVGLVQGPPDRRAAHGRVMGDPVDQGGGQVIEGPPRGRAILRIGSAAGQGDHIKALRGGKSSAVVRSAERLGAPPSRGPDSADARWRRCADRSGIRRRSGGWRACPRRRPGGSTGSGTPGPGESSGLEPSPRVGRAKPPRGKPSPRRRRAWLTSVMPRLRTDLRDEILSIAEITQLVQSPEIWRTTYETDI
jgi:hypothetical protein